MPQIRVEDTQPRSRAVRAEVAESAGGSVDPGPAAESARGAQDACQGWGEAEQQKLRRAAVLLRWDTTATAFDGSSATARAVSELLTVLSAVLTATPGPELSEQRLHPLRTGEREEGDLRADAVAVAGSDALRRAALHVADRVERQRRKRHGRRSHG